MKKTLQKHAMILVAFFIAAVFSAFTIAEKNSSKVTDALPQWSYKLNTTSGENNPANYELAEGSESCPGGSDVRCIIEAPDNGGEPDLFHPSMKVLSRKAPIQ